MQNKLMFMVVYSFDYKALQFQELIIFSTNVSRNEQTSSDLH